MFVEVGQSVSQAAIKQSADTFENVDPAQSARSLRLRVDRPASTAIRTCMCCTRAILAVGSRPITAVQANTRSKPCENSNEHEMFYVNLDTMADSIGTPYYEGVLAHEFQHMVQWYVDSNEDTWLNEGLSELATMLTGYGPSGFATDFLAPAEYPVEPLAGRRRSGAFIMARPSCSPPISCSATAKKRRRTLVRDPDNGLKSIANHADRHQRNRSRYRPAGDGGQFVCGLGGGESAARSVGGGWTLCLYLPGSVGSVQRRVDRPALNADGTLFVLEAPQWGAHYLEIEGGNTAQRVRVTFKGQPNRIRCAH